LPDAAVIGAGPTGLAAALTLAAAGTDVAIVAPPFSQASLAADRRTTALLPSSIELLKNLGVWRICGTDSAALEGVRIVDARGGLLRAPEVLFRARELGLESFGANIANSALMAALYAASRAAGIAWIETSAVVKVEADEGSVRLVLSEGGCVTAALAIAADGRKSLARAAAGIAARTWSYDQVAIAATLAHTRAHASITTELHRRAGPLTTVPLPASASSLVWVESPGEARRLMALDDRAFLSELETHLQGLLGSLTGASPRASYAIVGLSARRMGQGRIALAGESAHGIPPIGAQGLNLGLRDVAALADCVSDALARGCDIGGQETLEAYHAARSDDVLSRTLSVDLLNRSLLVDFLPVQAVRGLGLHLIANVAPLRRLVMRGGLEAAGPLPRLMQPGITHPGS
jgi:2-octaprenyl-6-methoxyphenol hydroxylase